MADFVAQINGLDFQAIDDALVRARTALAQGQQLSLDGLDPTSLLGDLGLAITAVGELKLDPDHLGDLGRQALAALGGLIEMPDVSELEQIVGALDELGRRLSELVKVFGGGDGGAMLDRVFGALSGSLNMDTLLGEITDRAVQVLGVAIPDEFARPMHSRAVLAGRPRPDELLDILGSVITGLDIADVGRLVGSADAGIRLVGSAGDAGPLEAAVGAARLRLDAAYAVLAGPTVDVDALLAAIDDVGVAIDAINAAAAGFAAGLATDLRTAGNAFTELDLTGRLDRVVAALPLPGEDIPQQLVDSLEGMADFFEQLAGPALTSAIAAMKDELLQVAGLDRLAELLSGLDSAFDEAGALLDRLPVRVLRDRAVATLVETEQSVLSFDGFAFLDQAMAPIRELDDTVRTLDLSTISDAVNGVVGQLNGLLADVDISPVRDAVDAVIDPLGVIVDELVPFVQQVADQLAELVDELRAIDLDAAGAATLDLLHGIRSQVAEAVEGGDVPEPVKAVVAGAAAVLRQLDVSAELAVPFADHVRILDVSGLIAPIEGIWQVAGEALAKATPAALIAELDPPFDQLLGALDQLSLQPLIDAVQRLFDDLVSQLDRLDPRSLVAPLENQFQDLVRALTHALDPAPLFAPLRAAYQALQDLLRQIDVTGLLHGVLGGLADMPHQVTNRMADRLQTGTGGGLPVGEGFRLGDVLRPLALFLAEIRGRLAEVAGDALGPVLTDLATATRGLRALADPETGYAVRMGEALDARLAWLDPRAGDGPLARLRSDLESFRLAVRSLRVDAAAQARLTASADGIQFDARVRIDAGAELATRADRLRSGSGSGGLGHSFRLLARALDAALPAELLTGTLDPAAATDAFLDAVFDRIDPTRLADQLDAIGVRIESRFVALAEEFGNGLFQLIDAVFASIEPLMPDHVISRLQAGVDRVLDRFTVLDPAPIEEEVRAIIRAAISLLAVHSPAALAAELGRVFDSCLDRVRSLSPATLFAGLDPFAPIKEQLAQLRPSTILAPLVDRTAGFSIALDTITRIDLSFATNIVGELAENFATVLDAVMQEWRALLDELADISGSATVSVG